MASDISEELLDFNITTQKPATTSHSSSLTTFYISLGVITIPGLITNFVALIFIIRDIRKAVFPAIILLFALCTADLAAVIFSLFRHALNRIIKEYSFASCAALSVLHSFFRIYGGVLNSMMAVDRLLALCTPFYYKRKIEVLTWKVGCLIAAFITACFTCFPVVGLGNVTTIRMSNGKSKLYCSTFSYRTDPVQKVYGMLYGVLGYLIVSIIVTLNTIVIVTVIKLSKRIVIGNIETSTTSGSGGPSKANNTSFEIAFAKLMGCLAAVYLICGIPYNVSL